MIRTKEAGKKISDRGQVKTHNNVLQGNIVQRALLASYLGFQAYNGARNVYQALGYPTNLTFKDYMARYVRQDIAKAIIDRPVKATWQGPLELLEANTPEETVFERSWRDLNRKLGLKTRLARLDRLTGLGHYGILLLGFSDTKEREDFKNPVNGNKSLVYVHPYSEGSASIKSYVDKTDDPRYGLPEYYDIEISDVKSNNGSTLIVHHSRIIHVTDNSLESDVMGTPTLEAVFNRLMDIEKIVGGDAEMFWRGARPGYHGKLNPEYQLTKETEDDLKEQIDEYEHDLRRFLINEGIDLEALAQQVADPANHLDAQLKMISSETGIPLRILTGSERGELASSEDRSEWLSFVQTRREEYAEPCIMRPLVDRLIEYGILPKPRKDYNVKWADLFAQSEKARVEIGKSRANALREYTSNPMAEAVIPPSAFMEYFLGFTAEQIELVNAIRDKEMEEEVSKMKDVKDTLGGELQNAPQEKDKTKEQRGEPPKKRELPDASV